MWYHSWGQVTRPGSGWPRLPTPNRYTVPDIQRLKSRLSRNYLNNSMSSFINAVMTHCRALRNARIGDRMLIAKCRPWVLSPHGP